MKMAVHHGIQLIMYGENGEVEYGGDMKNAHRPTREIQDHDTHYFSGKPPEFWDCQTPGQVGEKPRADDAPRTDRPL